jgi:excisionase family DNA binding protein
VSGDIQEALRVGIAIAKAGESETVQLDSLLVGCLWSLSRFGVALIDPWAIDLEPFGVRWREAPNANEMRPAYSNELVALLDTAAAIAHREGAKLGIPHVLACYSEVSTGVMGELKRVYGITSASWRAALARMQQPVSTSGPSPLPAGRPYFTPEEAAAYLGVHIQTMRGYIRNAKLPALRIAGERAIRLRREDLDALLEPLQAQEIEKEN